MRERTGRKRPLAFQIIEASANGEATLVDWKVKGGG